MASPAQDPAAAFAAFAAANPECLDPASFALLRQENPAPGYVLQPWPILLSAEKSRSMQEASVAVTAIATSLPRRIFGDDFAELAEYFRIPGGEVVAELILCEPNGIEEALYRGDFIDTRNGLKCIEINGGSAVGGWILPLLGRLYPRVPVLARFLAEHGWALHCPDTLAAMLGHFVDGARKSPALIGDGEINVAITAAAKDHEFYNPSSEAEVRRAYAAVLAAISPGLAGELRFCDYAELTFQGGRVFHQGKRVHVLFEQQVAEGPQRQQAIGSFKAGLLDLYTGPASQIIMDKRNLALMSELGGSSVFSEAERRAIRAVVPWTRRVVRGHTDYRGERVFIPDLLDAEREGLVLKKGYSSSGKHVFFGRATPAGHWAEQVTAALEEEGGWVVQEWLESVPYELLDEDRGPLPHDVVWGLFVFGGRFQGGFLRTLPKELDAVINLVHGARTLPYLELIAA